MNNFLTIPNITVAINGMKNLTNKLTIFVTYSVNASVKNRFVPKLVSEPNSYSLVINKLSLKQLIKCLLGNCFFFQFGAKIFQQVLSYASGCVCMYAPACICVFAFVWVFVYLGAKIC